MIILKLLRSLTPLLMLFCSVPDVLAGDILSEKGCRTNPEIIDKCFTIHGRVKISNGTPSVRIWQVGTKRLFGVLPSENEIMPTDLKKHLSLGTSIFGDFLICPFTKEKAGNMQNVCVESADNLVVEKYIEGAKRSYLSPDGISKAVIVDAGKDCKESKVEIYNQGHLLATRDYFSEDCDHGQVVEYARWAKNSQFFVFSMHSSGGHQSWAANVSFFDRKSGKMLDFMEYLPPIADTKFTLKAPDFITLNIWTPFNSDKGIEGSRILPITFRLRDIVDGEDKAKDFIPNR